MPDDAADGTCSQHGIDFLARYIAPRCIQVQSTRTVDFAIPWREVRVKENRTRFYELCEVIDEDNLVFQRGEAYTLNRSSHGILILVGTVLRLGQIIELNSLEADGQHSRNLYETRWIHRVKGYTGLHQVGCRLMFGPLS